MKLILFLGPAIAAAVTSYLLTPLAGRLAVFVGALDQPGPRKIHSRPIPRLGGLAVISAVGIVAIAAGRVSPWAGWLAPQRLYLGVALGAIPIIAVSILDDIKALRAGPKFMAHLCGAAIAVALGVSLRDAVHLFGHTIAIGWLAFPLSVLWLVGTTNAFNIVDGLDGLSAGLALIAAVTLSGVFLAADQTAMASAALVIAGGVAGFLPYNLFPARMFFGDTGATAIGFCLGAFALRGGATLSAGLGVLLPVFVLGLPIAETLISMARRLLKRMEQKDAGGVFEPDRNHMHHRLLALGIDHPRAVFILYGAGVVLAAAALMSTFLSAGNSALLVVALLLSGFLGVRRLGYDEFAIIRTGAVLRAYEAPVLNKSMFAVLVDLMIVATAAVLAVALKTDWSVVDSRREVFSMVGVLAPVTISVFWRMGLYRGTWRLAGVDDFVRAGCGVLIAAVLGMTARMLLSLAQPSLSLFSIYALVAIVLVTGSRASYQVLQACRWREGTAGSPTLIYGAGRKGATALRELAADPSSALRPVAFIDDDRQKEGQLVSGVPVVGSIHAVERAIRRFAIQTVIVACDGLPPARLEELGRLCEEASVRMLKLRMSIDTLAGVGARAFSATAASAIWAGQKAGVERTVLQQALAATKAVSPALAATRRDARPAPNLRFEQAFIRGFEVPAVATGRCPACRARTLRRSHGRTMAERVRKKLTQKRLFRCEDCGWRGWSHIVDPCMYGTPAVSNVPPLDPVDPLLHRSPAARAS